MVPYLVWLSPYIVLAEAVGVVLRSLLGVSVPIVVMSVKAERFHRLGPLFGVSLLSVLVLWVKEE